MNIYNVRITPQAEEQLEEILYYITENLNNPDAAEAFVDEFEKEVNKLSKNPEKHRPIDEEPWGSEGIRKITIKNYYVYFEIDIEKSIVWVVAIVFAEREQNKFLSSINLSL